MHRTGKVGILNSKPAEVNGEKTKSPLWGGERDAEGKKKTRQVFVLVQIKRGIKNEICGDFAAVDVREELC